MVKKLITGLLMSGLLLLPMGGELAAAPAAEQDGWALLEKGLPRLSDERSRDVHILVKGSVDSSEKTSRVEGSAEGWLEVAESGDYKAHYVLSMLDKTGVMEKEMRCRLMQYGEKVGQDVVVYTGNGSDWQKVTLAVGDADSAAVDDGAAAAKLQEVLTLLRQSVDAQVIGTSDGLTTIRLVPQPSAGERLIEEAAKVMTPEATPDAVLTQVGADDFLAKLPLIMDELDCRLTLDSESGELRKLEIDFQHELQLTLDNGEVLPTKQQIKIKGLVFINDRDKPAVVSVPTYVKQKAQEFTLMLDKLPQPISKAEDI